MQPLDYLLLQLELEGIQRVSGHLIACLAEDVEDFPLVLSARTADGVSLVCFDERIPEQIRGRLSVEELRGFRLEPTIAAFREAGLIVKPGHYKTYIFPDGLTPADIARVQCFDRNDPKIVAFGFAGLGAQVFAIEDQGTILSACVSSRQNARAAESWVFTHPDHRRKGLARQSVVAWAAHIRATGLVPFYSHSTENINSALLAHSLGLIPVFEELVIERAS